MRPHARIAANEAIASLSDVEFDSHVVIRALAKEDPTSIDVQGAAEKVGRMIRELTYAQDKILRIMAHVVADNKEDSE